MRKIIMTAAALPVLTAIRALGPAPALATDATIDAFEAAQQAAWNAHDASTYTAAFDSNAQIITAQGWHWTGQADAAGNIGNGFKLVYLRARIEITDVQARMLTPELASVTLRWTIDDARTIDGGRQAGPQHGFETQLLQRRGDGWVILAQQDTAATPLPLPAPPQPAEQAAPAAATFPTTPPPVRRCIVARANGDCLIYGKAKKD